ncbi:peptide methionine sulfoxide reductase [Spongisporangium articulatum]|uniref:Peptide methionine sulfoxide reductase n=1 Tax=Spongisporangium articulatum TaxID=3362603 RepID=A0ABW8AKR6_9ACTN
MAESGVAALLARLPLGWSAVTYRGRRWGVTRTVRAGGRVEKLYAEELGGTGVVSANLYLPAPDDEQFRPCEMPASDVLDFLHGWEPAPRGTTG